MKKNDKLLLYKQLLLQCKRAQINDQFDNKSNLIYGNDKLPKMKIKSLFRKGR